jgi:hypothetical protein
VTERILALDPSLTATGYVLPDGRPGVIRATYATGKGNASKEAVLAEAVRRFNYQGNDNNEADALVLWCLAQDAAGTPAVVVPATHRRVLTSVEWPESFRAHLTTAT